ncbi:MAG TPA: diguanylate cyclase [Candidatus Accumulibacter phosphatis]|nr:MAG: Stalked cell differentiation-controlling protein [Candidatus Accumulibacter sp. SK-11]HAY27483.1 GGDEF domain-containing protein [Accumulibacter sp.]HCN67584.1 GGDEF domain-containing protein [Accumulibacter sp.]HRL74463.1 diguanylate cyclase [Candidatus Accumulibacter phosphatis]HRQ93906.1 diguanylate cyclase [Candidatus Accumulibacter phosphatis]
MERKSIRGEEWARPRTVVVLTLLLLAALWSVVIVSMVVARRDSIAATGGALQQLTHALEEQTRQQFRLLDTVLVATDHWLQERPLGSTRNDPSFRHFIDDLRASSGDSFDIWLLTADGSTFAATGKEPWIPAQLASSDRFAHASGGAGLSIGPPVADPTTSALRLPVTRAASRASRHRDTPVAMLAVETLRRSYDAQRPRPGGVIALLGRDGTVLAEAADDRQHARSLAKGALLFGQHLPQQSRAFVLLDEDGGEHPRMFASYSSLPDFPLVVVVLEDYDAALGDWQRQSVWTVLLALGMTIPLSVVAWRSLRLLRVLAERGVQVRELAISDGLTGVSSRQHFVRTLAGELARSERRWSPLAVLLLDIDFFRRINDGYGHAVGDQALVAVAQAAKRALRQCDLLARFDSGQFAVLLPDTEIIEALLVAERIRAQTGEIAIPTENGIVRFSISVGASAALTGDRSPDELLKRAAQALHAAAAAGHDRVVAA